MDTFIDWTIEAGYGIQRIESYDDWYRRFETALRGLPDKQRQQSSLPLLHQLRRPISPGAGALASAVRFETDVRKSGTTIPHLSAAFIRKFLNDLRVLQLVTPS
jgi:fatty acid CoA ligase FadD9